MKSLNDFCNGINVQASAVNEDKADIKKQQKETLTKAKGKEAEDNLSGGVYDVEPPTEDDVLKGIDRDTLTKNKKRVLMRLKAHEPFFIQGEAGWGKTSVITKCAHQCGLTVITVYLDKAEATDLGGIPVAKQGKRGADYVDNLMPGWAKVIYDNPDVNFLLFFDEMNQAAPDVMNALMPIVLKNVICGKKFENIVVGAAGNYEEENQGGITELSKPLLSRFGGIIHWQSGDWTSAFKHLHSKWDSKIGAEFISLLDEHHDLFSNPRDVENHVIDKIYNLKKDKDLDIWDASDYLDEMTTIAKPDLSRTEEASLAKLAEKLYDFMMSKGSTEEDGGRARGGKKDISMVPKDIIEGIELGMTRGYILQKENGKNVRYGISRENIASLCDDEVINADMLERIVKKLETDGKKFMYEKNEQWKAKGYVDPEAEDFMLADYKPGVEEAPKKEAPRKGAND